MSTLHRGAVAFPLQIKNFAYAQEKGGTPQMGVELVDDQGHALYRGHAQQGAREQAHKLKARLEEGQLGLEAELPNQRDIAKLSRPYVRLFSLTLVAMGASIVLNILGASGWAVLVAFLGLGFFLGEGTRLEDVAKHRRQDDKVYPPFRLEGNMRVEGPKNDNVVPGVACSIEIVGTWGSRTGRFQRLVARPDQEGEEVARIIEVIREAQNHREALAEKTETVNESLKPTSSQPLNP